MIPDFHRDKQLLAEPSKFEYHEAPAIVTARLVLEKLANKDLVIATQIERDCYMESLKLLMAHMQEPKALAPVFVNNNFVSAE